MLNNVIPDVPGELLQLLTKNKYATTLTNAFHHLAERVTRPLHQEAICISQFFTSTLFEEVRFSRIAQEMRCFLVSFWFYRGVSREGSGADVPAGLFSSVFRKINRSE